MKQLPVYKNRQQILDALKDHQVIIVESPTGSGKTTQLPLILKEAGYCDALCVGITQPRRIATLSVCEFIKKQLHDEDGYVGYKMRFTDTTGPNTRIKIMTDGILLMELKADAQLSNYGVIVVDEAHERSLNIDFILGLLKNLLIVRPDLKVIISSATINTKVFSSFFDEAPIISIKSQIFPVQVIYKPLSSNDILIQIDTIVQLVKKQAREAKGDVLVFMSGEFDITRTVTALSIADPEQKLIIYPLYARLSKEEQESVFTPTPLGKTKVVIATNIAETSVTIEGITMVIDCGIAKINFYNQKDFTSSLVPLPTSKSSAEQRKGRAGRTSSGICYRLYAEKDFESRSSYSTEEILRTDLSEVVLRMSDLKIYDYEHFPFITKPKNSAILSAENTLRFIGAIDEKRQLTNIGELMCRFPLLPRHSRVIVESLIHYPDVLQQVLVAVAFISCKTPFLFPAGEEDLARLAQQNFADSQYGDFVTYLHVFERYTKNATNEEKQKFCIKYYLDYQSMQEIVHVSEQLGQICTDIGFTLSGNGTAKEFLVCIASGLLQYICIKKERNIYKSLTADMIFLHPGSAYFRTLPKFIIAGEIVQTSRMYARSVSPLQKEWLDEIHPGLYEQLNQTKPTLQVEDRASRPVEGDFRDNKKKSNAVIQVYRRSYPTIELGKRQDKICAVIPLEDLDYLTEINGKASKRPKNFCACLSYQGYYVHLGDKFFSLLDLCGKLQINRPIMDFPPSGTFPLDGDMSILLGKLDNLLNFCKSKKDRHSLGFVQLEGNNDYYRFSFNKDFFDALDTTLFYLGQLQENLKQSKLEDMEIEVNKYYSRLLKLAD